MFSLIRASFNQRRKTLVNGLTNGGVAQKEQVLWALSEMNLPATIRGEALTLSPVCSPFQFVAFHGKRTTENSQLKHGYYFDTGI